MTAIPKSYRGYFAVALFLILVVAMAAIVAMPFMRVALLENAIAEKRARLPELLAEVTYEDKLKSDNAEFSALGQDKSLLLEGDKTGVAGANLQSLINSLVSANGGTASSIQILPPKEDGNLMQISVSVSINVGTDGLRDIIHTLETGTPLIFIDNVTVRTIHDDFRPLDPHYVGPLDVTLQVSGFAAQRGAS